MIVFAGRDLFADKVVDVTALAVVGVDAGAVGALVFYSIGLQVGWSGVTVAYLGIDRRGHS